MSTPGPGLSRLSQNRSSPKWSFRARTFGNEGAYEHRKDNPGPGAYNTDSSANRHKTPASYGFGSSHTGRGMNAGRSQSANPAGRPASAPGPGQYKHENMKFATKNASPNYGFGKSAREGGGALSSIGREGIEGVLASPGPGAYNGDSAATRHAQPTYTACPRRPQSAGHVTPGPGSYAATRAKPGLPDSPKWRFGTSPRGRDVERDIPGPGNYNMKTNMGGEGSPKFTMRAKRENFMNRDEGTPGPGAHGGPFTQFE